MSIKQSTLDENINAESVAAYVRRLRTWAERERDRYWLREPSRDELEVTAALDRAADELERALAFVRTAEHDATDAGYARIYNRVPRRHVGQS